MVQGKEDAGDALLSGNTPPMSNLNQSIEG